MDGDGLVVALAHRLLFHLPSVTSAFRGEDVALTHGEHDTGRTAATAGPEQRRLLRRLLVACPATGVATDTGFELTDVPSVASGPQLLIDCLECGQDHEWGIDDAMLGGDFGEALDRARTGTVS